jgi:hypothetical protein
MIAVGLFFAQGFLVGVAIEFAIPDAPLWRRGVTTLALNVALVCLVFAARA